MTQSTEIALSREQVREVDRRAIEDLAIPGVVLMENASRSAAAVLQGLSRKPGPIAIVCGRGNNGGDGFAMARHLANAGEDVMLYLACDPDTLKGDAATNARIAKNMGIPHTPFNTPEAIAAAAPALSQASAIVDAVLGTGFHGDVRSPLDLVIQAINAAKQAVILAVDLPSGLDCNTGEPSNATVRAHHTVTFVAKKKGFLNSESTAYTGEVHVADIGAPPRLIQDVLSSTSSG